MARSSWFHLQQTHTGVAEGAALRQPWATSSLVLNLGCNSAGAGAVGASVSKISTYACSLKASQLAGQSDLSISGQLKMLATSLRLSYLCIISCLVISPKLANRG